MIAELDAPTVVFLLVTAALVGALAGAIAPWRRLLRDGELPVHRFAPRLSGSEGLEASLRCALCAQRERCASLAAPPADCANRDAFGRA